MFIEGSVEQRGLMTRVRIRLCEAGIVKAAFKHDYPSNNMTQERVIKDMTKDAAYAYDHMGRIFSYSTLMLAYSTVAFAGDGGTDTSSAAFVIRTVTMLVHKLIDLF
jgi:hypothetical protein